MPVFAVYYVPPGDSALYIAGSQILGYDVRAGELLPESNPARDHLSVFDPEWATIPQEFGFHITIGHAVTFEAGRLAGIQQELESVLMLFDAMTPFIITPDEDYLPFKGRSATVYYQPNQSFMMFHALVVARLHPLGFTTPTHQCYHQGDHTPKSPARVQHIEQYYHDGIFTDWHPHFGLLRPVPAEHRDAVREGLLAALPTPEPITLESVCLLLREDNEPRFQIINEYTL